MTLKSHSFTTAKLFGDGLNGKYFKGKNSWFIVLFLPYWNSIWSKPFDRALVTQLVIYSRDQTFDLYCNHRMTGEKGHQERRASIWTHGIWLVLMLSHNDLAVRLRLCKENIKRLLNQCKNFLYRYFTEPHVTNNIDFKTRKKILFVDKS